MLADDAMRRKIGVCFRPSIRSVGPEIDSAATGIPFGPNTGTATQRRPGCISSSSKAIPDRRMRASCMSSSVGSVMVRLVYRCSTGLF
ncbi:Uncharacterised protein [Mycobacteroides abscessus subsp. abscessus]|nr:Uncharacterised protein [Mycobacteroides abscessus subsp. abscessus]